MIALALALTTVSALRVPGPLSPRDASYRIEARLDAEQHTVTATEHITWRNPTSAPARELVFHLYMNAFKNQASTFWRESRGRLRQTQADEKGWGAIDMTRLTVAGTDLTREVKVDDTLARVTLPAPVEGGATVELEVAFTALLPKVFARSGYHEDFFAIAQWFPKLGVWDCDGSNCRWRAHQHHANSEFFADYGTYDVALDAPARFVVAGTGIDLSAHPERSAEGAESKGRKTWRFHAEDVHDFALFACPRFVVHEERVRDALGGVDVLFYGIPGHEANVPRHLAAVRAGLAELQRRFGAYPYARLSVIDIPRGAEGAGGMEYPTLITTFDAPVPAGVHLPELVTAHELAHQWFYGMVNSDEVEEAWLDEGLTDTATDWVLERMFGRAGSEWQLGGHRASASEVARIAYRHRATVDPLETRAFEFESTGSYGAITYSKTVAMLRSLESVIGAGQVEAGLRRYFETWKFKHPRLADFVRTFDEGAGQDLTWFWTPLLRTAQPLDVEILRITVEPKRAPAGLFDGPDGKRTTVAPEKDRPRQWSSEVIVHQKGELALPVDVRVQFSDGSEQRERWDPRADGVRWKKYVYEGPRKVIAAEVDPEHKLPLDVERWNDGLRTEPDAGPRRRVSSAFAAFVSTLLALVGF